MRDALAPPSPALVVDEHLLAWGPGFARLVAEGADTDLYRAVGHLLTGALPQLDGLLAEG